MDGEVCTGVMNAPQKQKKALENAFTKFKIVVIDKKEYQSLVSKANKEN